MKQCYHCGLIGPSPICINCHNVNAHGPDRDEEPLGAPIMFLVLMVIVIGVLWLIGD